ncbi:MAG: class I SAM-dependent methyltransferase [Planctomycetota bacterium]|jgi:SAM-dependent methyltransferase
MFAISDGVIETFYKILHWVMVYDWVLLGGAAAFAILLVSLYKFERRYIHDFESVAESQLPKLSWYTCEMNDQARRLGFQHCGWYGQKRKGLYKAIATMWMSPDNLKLLVVGGGKIAGINYKVTYLYSKIIGVTTVVTSDEIGEADVSGIFDKQYLCNADLEELCKVHESRLAMWKGKLKKFDISDVLAEYEAIMRQRVCALVERGFAKWLNKDQEKWRYTLKGSILSYIDFRRESRQVKQQSERHLKRRPGEAIGGFGSMGIMARMRDLLMSPREIVEHAGVGLGNVVLDFGCGDWTCSIAAAKAVGTTGRVYALDVHPDACAEVERRAKQRGLKNIKTIKSDCATGLRDKSMDIVFMHEVLHALGEDKQTVLKELCRILKDKGILSLSDHYMKEKEIMATLLKKGLFRLLEKGEDLYKFQKIRV